MKTYISLFKLRFINSIQYRKAALAGICTQFFFGFVFISVYLAFYSSTNNTKLPMNLNELINYLWLNQAFFALVYTWYKDKNLINLIKNGNISYEFIRPINFYKKWFSSMYGDRLSAVILRSPLVILIAFFLPKPYNLTLPNSINSLVLFIIFMIISSLLINAFTMIYHLLIFYTLDEKGIITLFMVIGEIFAGGTIPIAFFPKLLRIISSLLPFRYIADLPFRIYSGNFNITNILPNLIGAIIWLIVLLIIGNKLTNNISKKVIVQGG